LTSLRRRAAGRSRGDQRGLIKGCCLGMLLLLVAVGYTAYIIDRAVSGPDLGSAPRGPNHGNNELAIAATLAPQLAASLIVQPHAVITLSEHDLTVLATQNNPRPAEYHNVSVRVRGGMLLVAADVGVGPFRPTALAHVAVTFDSTSGQVRISSQVGQIDLGQLSLPGWLKDRFVAQVMQSTALLPLFADGSALKSALSNIECLAAADEGVRIGVHRAGTTADASTCGF
jgi:hypothetical protein